MFPFLHSACTFLKSERFAVLSGSHLSCFSAVAEHFRVLSLQVLLGLNSGIPIVIPSHLLGDVDYNYCFQ